MAKILGTPLMAEDSFVGPEARAVIAAFSEKEMAVPYAPPATDDPLCPKRLNRVSHTLPELNAQADKMEETVREERSAIAEAARHLAQREINRVYLTGCGDSIASLDGSRYLLEEALDIPCEPVQALDFAYYYNKTVDEKSLVIMLSSSGNTLRTLEAMYAAQARGAQTLTLSNTPGSILMEKSSRGLLIHATRKGWPTQASTSAMALVMQLGIFLGRERKSCSAERLDWLQAEFDKMPGLVRSVTENCRKKVRELAVEWADKSIFKFVAGGPSYCCAFFGAAKVKEATADTGVAVPLEEFHHYNSVKDGEPVFVVAPSGYCVPRARDTLAVSRYFGAESCVVTTEGEDELAGLADHAILLPAVPEYFSGFVYSVPVQMFGYYVAMEKFYRAGLERKED